MTVSAITTVRTPKTDDAKNIVKSLRKEIKQNTAEFKRVTRGIASSAREYKPGKVNSVTTPDVWRLTDLMTKLAVQTYTVEILDKDTSNEEKVAEITSSFEQYLIDPESYLFKAWGNTGLPFYDQFSSYSANQARVEMYRVLQIVSD